MLSLSDNEFSVINFLVRNFTEKLTIRNVAQRLNFSAAGVFNILKKLEKAGIVIGQRLGTGLFYSINFDNKQLSDFHSRKIGQMSRFAAKDVEAISVVHGNRVTSVEKQNGKWKLVSPKVTDADESFITSFIESYQTLTAEKVYSTAEIQKLGGEKKFNLKVPSATVSFKGAQGKPLQFFSLSISKEGISMPLGDGSFGQVPIQRWPDLVPEDTAFQIHKKK